MSPSEQDEVDRRLKRLEDDPSPDGVTTLDVPDVANIRLLDDGTWRLVYSVPDEATVVVFAISHAFDLPH